MNQSQQSLTKSNDNPFLDNNITDSLKRAQPFVSRVSWQAFAEDERNAMCGYKASTWKSSSLSRDVLEIFTDLDEIRDPEM
jgi:hypothetical protein